MPPSVMSLRFEGKVDGAPRRVRLDVLGKRRTRLGVRGFRACAIGLGIHPALPPHGPGRARTLPTRLSTTSFASTTVRVVD